MKNRGTYALLALFFAGLVGLWVADFAQIPTRSQRERMSSRLLHELLDTKPDDLRKIEILGGEDGPIVFERRSRRAKSLADDRADARGGRPFEGRDPGLQPEGAVPEARGRHA